LSRISSQIVSRATTRIVVVHSALLNPSSVSLPEYCITMMTTSSGSRNSAIEIRAST
jgi:hypothetical protein